MHSLQATIQETIDLSLMQDKLDACYEQASETGWQVGGGGGLLIYVLNPTLA